MNKTKKIIVSIFAGADVVFYLATPLIILAIWASIGGNNLWLISLVAIMASIFRGYKIGWMKGNE
jgi:hypothetical protein